MKIGVSNLAWAPEVEGRALSLLAAEGAIGVEVAPTRTASWDGLTPERLRAFRNACSAEGLTIPSLQAIFYGQSDARLLGSPEQFAKMSGHMHRVGAIAEALGARVAVFGAPHNRTRQSLPSADARGIAVERLSALGDIAMEYDLTLGMEAVPAYYGNDFAVHASELAEVVRDTAHPYVGFHMDIACAKMTGDDPVATVLNTSDLLVHYHAAEPMLGAFSAPVCDHVGTASALRQAKFEGWVVIEMTQHGDGLAAIAEALRVVRSAYR